MKSLEQLLKDFNGGVLRGSQSKIATILSLQIAKSVRCNGRTRAG